MPRRRPRHTTIAIGASLVVHVAVIGDVLVQRARAAREISVWPTVAVQPPRVAPAPDPTTELQVVLLDDAQLRAAMPTPAPAPPPPAHSAPVAPPPARIRDDGARHAPPRAITEAPAPPAAPVAPPAPRSAFAMRAPDESPGVDVSPWRIAEGLVPAAPGTPAPGVAPTRAPPRDGRGEELVRQRDGSYRSEHSTFTAKVAADGTVKFDDAPIVRPGTGADQSGPAGARDPSMRGGGIEGAGAGGVGGTMDVTEMMMRRRGVDPHAHEKLAFLDRTRDERAAIASDHKSTQLSKSGRLMRRTLEEMWASTRDPVERKQALFELWDECAETGDPETIAGAQQARAEIMSFIRARLRGPAAFTPAEVARFNARKQSRARFAPGAG